MKKYSLNVLLRQKLGLQKKNEEEYRKEKKNLIRRNTVKKRVSVLGGKKRRRSSKKRKSKKRSSKKRKSLNSTSDIKNKPSHHYMCYLPRQGWYALNKNGGIIGSREKRRSRLYHDKDQETTKEGKLYLMGNVCILGNKYS
jgi:hypothetical protein